MNFRPRTRRIPRSIVALATVVLVVSAGCLGGTGPSPAASSSPSGSASPSATAPGASPSENPTLNPIYSASPAASASLSPAPSPTPPTAIIPADFSPRSITFVSANEGWVLGGTACGSAMCPVIARTTDAGRTWRRVAAPATTMLVPPEPVGGTGVSEIRFADPKNGWVYAPDLWATHDGGLTWHRLTLPAPLAGGPVVALEAARGAVHAVAPVDASYRIASSATIRDAWGVAPVSLDLGAGPVPRAQLVLAGSSGWVLVVNRTVIGGARLVGGGWRTWTPPCATSAGPAVLAAWSATGLIAACDIGRWSTPHGEHLFLSTDGGSSFTEPGTPVSLDDVSLAAAATPWTFFLEGATPSGASLIASFDAGATWGAVLHPATTARAGYLGFTTATQGVFIDDAGLFITRDGGHSWGRVKF